LRGDWYETYPVDHSDHICRAVVRAEYNSGWNNPSRELEYFPELAKAGKRAGHYGTGYAGCSAFVRVEDSCRGKGNRPRGNGESRKSRKWSAGVDPL
jgi:hypothetical protein